MGVRRRAVMSGPQEICPSGAFRYYRRRCGVSNLGRRPHPPPPPPPPPGAKTLERTLPLLCTFLWLVTNQKKQEQERDERHRRDRNIHQKKKTQKKHNITDQHK